MLKYALVESALATELNNDTFLQIPSRNGHP